MSRPVIVACFWGGHIVSGHNDFTYSDHAQRTVRMPHIMTLTELKTKLYALTMCDPLKVNLKLKYKIPMQVSNGIGRYTIQPILDDDDVALMLSVPEEYYGGKGSVELFIEFEQVQTTPRRIDDNSVGPSTSLSTRSNPSASMQHDCRDNVVGSSGDPCPQVDMVDIGSSSHSNRARKNNLDGLEMSKIVGDLSTREEFNGHDPEESDDDNDREHQNDSDDVNHNDDTEFEVRNNDITVKDNDENDGNDDDIADKEYLPSAPWFKTEELKDAVLNGGRDFPAFDYDGSKLCVNQLFNQKSTLVAAVRLFHIKDHRQFRVLRSTKSMFIAECSQSGCSWRLRALKRKKSGLFEIRKLPALHTCARANETQDHVKISSKLIADAIKDKVVESPKYKVSAIQVDIQKLYDHHVTYKKAWYGKQIAVASIYGDWVASYSSLPRFMAAVIHYNPGTVVEIEADRQGSTSVFKCVWWAFKGTIDGWQHARPVLTIDGTVLKGKYNGKLLVAMAFDSNKQQYPVAYALVDEETVDNWGWFLRNLRTHVCKERTGVCVISDCHASIIRAMEDIYNGFVHPLGVHRYCLFHVHDNFCSAHPGLMLKDLCWRAGSTCQKRKFEFYMSRIRDISVEAEQWLRGIPLEMWTLSHDGGHRYGVTSTNVVECFNNNIKHALFLPVTAMAEYIFFRTVKLFNSRRMEAHGEIQDGYLYSKEARKCFARIDQKATTHQVESFNNFTGIFNVRTNRRLVNDVWKGNNVQNVNLKELFCTCGKWQQLHYPCSHVVAACLSVGDSWTHWINIYETNAQSVKMWNPNFYPLAHKDYWTFPLPEQWELFGTLTPGENLKKKKGEKTVRIQTEMDGTRKQIKCGACGEDGHTKRSRRCRGGDL